MVLAPIVTTMRSKLVLVALAITCTTPTAALPTSTNNLTDITELSELNVPGLDFERKIAGGLAFLAAYGVSEEEYSMMAIKAHPLPRLLAKKAEDFCCISMSVVSNARLLTYATDNFLRIGGGWSGPNQASWDASSSPGYPWRMSERGRTLSEAMNILRRAGYHRRWNEVLISRPRNDPESGGRGYEVFYLFKSGNEIIGIGAISGRVIGRRTNRTTLEDTVSAFNSTTVV